MGDTRVVAHPVQHPVPAYGYRVESPVAAFGYSGDTALCAGLGRVAAGVDMLLCDALRLGTAMQPWLSGAAT